MEVYYYNRLIIYLLIIANDFNDQNLTINKTTEKENPTNK